MAVRWPLVCVAVLATSFLLPAPAAAEPAGDDAAQDRGQSSPGGLRTWTDATGQFRIEAELLAVAQGAVQLRKSDGSTISVPLAKLSRADQTWLAKQRAASATGSASAARGQGAADAEWPGWLGTNRDGKSPDRGLLKQWPEGGPPLLWKASQIGKGFSGPAIAGGMVYITGDTPNALVIHALDTDGRPKWTAENGPPCKRDWPGARATPSIDGNNLYLLSGTGRLGCFDAKSGKLHWAVEAKQFGGDPGGWGYAESPLVLGNLVIFKPGGGTALAALNKRSGKTVWTTRGLSAGPEYGSCLAVLDRNGPIVVAPTRSGIIGVQAANGALVWQNKFSADNVANCPTPAYSNGYVFWANGYDKGGICLRLGKLTAREAWTTHDMVCHHGGYIIDQGSIYGNNGDGWTCLDLATGRTKWSEHAVGKGSLCWADGMLYLFSEKGGRAALATCSPDGLEIKGRLQVQGSGPSWAHPVVVGGRLYLRYDTTLYCFDVRAKP